MRSDRPTRRPTSADGPTVALPPIDARGTRQQWTRSALAATDGAAIVGTGGGTVRALSSAGEERWSVDLGGMVTALEPTRIDGDPAVVAGTRGESARIVALDAATGRIRWRYPLVPDLGRATRETPFYYPMVVDLTSDPRDGLYAAARRYERPDGDRRFESRIYAFDGDGRVAWTYATDASPVALARRDDRLAVAYNRCPGGHQHGLVVLGAADGTARVTWDPGTAGDRRVGDAALVAGGVVLASHGDYRGYALDERGRERWSVDLGTPREIDGETVYAYPTRAIADERGAVFATGNTFPEDGRETDARHPREHALVAVEEGGVDWTTPIEGWVGDLALVDGALAVACGQHFRDRDPDGHALRVVDRGTGTTRETGFAGVVTALAGVGDRIAALEEPVEYHDEDDVRGAHRLHFLDRAAVGTSANAGR